MTQRFNAPPGWQVPAGFVPTAEWQPDPSWPPAPQGWSFWVDDAVPAYAASFAADTGAAAGTAGPVAQPSNPFAAGAELPVGAYGSTAPGSAQATIAKAQRASARRSIVWGIALIPAGIILAVVLYQFGYWSTWSIALPIFGVISLVRGLIDMNKAKKAAAAARGQHGAVASLPGVTPPGQNPPGSY